MYQPIRNGHLLWAWYKLYSSRIHFFSTTETDYITHSPFFKLKHHEIVSVFCPFLYRMLIAATVQLGLHLFDQYKPLPLHFSYYTVMPEPQTAESQNCALEEVVVATYSPIMVE